MKIYITHPLPVDVGREFSGTDIEVITASEHPDRHTMIDAMKDADGVICLLRDSIDRDLIEQCPKLKIIANYAVGYDNIDLEFSANKHIYVTNTPDVLTETTADLAWGLMLAAARRIPEADQYTRHGHFHGWKPDEMLGTDIFGMTLGIFGFGRIGQSVGRRGTGFNMNIIYTARHDKDIDYKAQRVDFETLIEKSDFISINAPLTSETEGVFNAEVFSRMKNSAILVNTARGRIIRENDLANALSSGDIYAAALDVYEYEPDINRALKNLDNCILSPHMGSATLSTRSEMVMMCIESLKAVLLDKEVPPRCVNSQYF